jgi:hypothetical protein
MADFLKSVADAFSVLTSRGQLAVESSTYDAQAFGNAVVVLAGQSLRIRVIRDRDDTFADAASCLDPENWYPLQRVIRAAGANPPPPEGLLTPGDAAELVERHYAALNRSLAAAEWNQTRVNLERLGQEALARMTSRVQGCE